MTSCTVTLTPSVEEFPEKESCLHSFPHSGFPNERVRHQGKLDREILTIVNVYILVIALLDKLRLRRVRSEKTTSGTDSSRFRLTSTRCRSQQDTRLSGNDASWLR